MAATPNKQVPSAPAETSAPAPAVVAKVRMVVVEPVHGDMRCLESNVSIPRTEGGGGSRVKHTAFIQCQIDAGKLTLIDG